MQIEQGGLFIATERSTARNMGIPAEVHREKKNQLQNLLTKYIFCDIMKDRKGGDSLHEIIFYTDAAGNSPVLDYLEQLAKTNGKDARIRLKKAQDYINILKEYGTTAGEPYMKHLDGDIWEIRPASDRILFAGVVGGRFVLLHQFMKKTQKTPKREIEQAKRELADYIERSV